MRDGGKRHQESPLFPPIQVRYFCRQCWNGQPRVFSPIVTDRPGGVCAKKHTQSPENPPLRCAYLKVPSS
jgi:hypothetical protein